jgi:prevent-host-death family protein
MKQINLSKAKTDLSKLVDEASKGETFVIAKSGTPLAKLGPLDKRKKRTLKYGTMKGKIWISPDFGDPLPDWLLDAFEGKSD